MSGPPGSFYFGLFLGAPNPGSYTFTGLYATNTGVNGLFNGGVVAVPGWAPGTTQTYFVAGWNAGHDFQPIWLDGMGISGVFGEEGYGSGVAGNGSSVPTLNLFDGGGNTLQIGFRLRNNLVPEPSTYAIAALGAGLILFSRMQERRNN